MEFVQDKVNKTPFDPSVPLNKMIKQASMQAGLMCYPMSGTIDGRLGHHILFAPPYTIEDQHIDEIGEKLSLAIQQSFQRVSVA